MKFDIEITDTFGGEANYAWVRRHTLDVSPKITDLALVRRAKRKAEWSGIRCKVSRYGDTIEIRPHGVCCVLFIVPNEEVAS